MDNLLDRFIRYVKIDTQSDFNSKISPSSKKQLDLAVVLKEELISLGLNDVELDENGYIMATLPANTDKNAPVIGLIAHMDTSPDMSGNNVNPKIIKDYDGNDIILNQKNNTLLSPDDFKELKNYTGKTLITTDGTTLLGADDKAGIAEIMTALEYLINNPQIKHGRVRIAFSPDEEIGRGADNLDVKKFGAAYAYTVDGGELGQLEYENFNAANVNVTINGKNIHPGSAKNKMKNSILIAYELHSMLPVNERPEFTEMYEGFFHLNSISGTVEKTDMYYIIRDHDKDKFNNKKTLFKKAVDFINKKYGPKTVKYNMKEMYYNMREKIEPVFHVVEIAKKAIEKAGITPIINPIRGGTDGAKLSYKGLPTPNIFTGGHNFHGKYEYIPLESMHKAVEVIINIIELYLQ